MITNAITVGTIAGISGGMIISYAWDNNDIVSTTLAAFFGLG